MIFDFLCLLVIDVIVAQDAPNSDNQLGSKRNTHQRLPVCHHRHATQRLRSVAPLKITIQLLRDLVQGLGYPRKHVLRFVIFPVEIVGSLNRKDHACQRTSISRFEVICFAAFGNFCLKHPRDRIT